jgi:hypothetical protein
LFFFCYCFNYEFKKSDVTSLFYQGCCGPAYFGSNRAVPQTAHVSEMAACCGSTIVVIVRGPAQQPFGSGGMNVPAKVGEIATKAEALKRMSLSSCPYELTAVGINTRLGEPRRYNRNLQKIRTDPTRRFQIG